MIKKKSSNGKVPKKGATSRFGKFIAWIHLWPSLISAVILIIICLTGTIIVYSDEIIDFANKDALYVPEVKKEKLPVTELMQKFKAAFPHRSSPGYMVMYRNPERSVKLNSYDKEKGLRFVYMDPYTGEVLKDDGTVNFFFVTAHLHSSLLLHKTGEWIIDIASIIFLIELITGLVLWWPRKWTKTTREQSFKIKWKARFKRLNYDLHNVVGFYSVAIVLVLTVTGLIIAFKPLASFTISSFGGDPSEKWEETLPEFKPDSKPYELNLAVDRYFAKHPWAEAAQVYSSKMDSAGYFMFTLAKRVGLKSREGNYPVFIDRFSGAEIDVPNPVFLHEKIENSYWTLHMGTWLGWFGKLITFTGGLISTTLPITGFYIWWGRRKKKKKKNKHFNKPSKVSAI